MRIFFPLRPEIPPTGPLAQRADDEWTATLTVDEVEVTFELGRGRRRAGELAIEVRTRLRRGDPVSLVRRWLAAELERPDLSPPTFREVAAVFGRATLADANPQTRDHYLLYFFKIPETVLRFHHGASCEPRYGQILTPDDFDIADYPVTYLDASVIATYGTVRLTGVAAGPATETTQRSVGSAVTFARQVLSPEARTHYRLAGLKVPALRSFLDAPTFSRRDRKSAPPEARIIAAHAALRHLAQTGDEEMFIVVALALIGGLRPEEIEFARYAWLQGTTGPSIAIRIEDDFETKTGPRIVQLPLWLYERLRLRPPGGHLLSGGPTRRGITLRLAADWLRAHGSLAVDRPIQELRAFRAGFLINRHPPSVVMAEMGHLNIRTTLEYYACHELSAAVLALWDTELPSVPPDAPGGDPAEWAA